MDNVLRILGILVIELGVMGFLYLCIRAFIRRK